MKITTVRVIIAIALTAIAIIIYFLFSPEESNIFPQCLFHYLTGYDCPGCGSQRVFHSLLHFRFKDAFFYNPLLFLSIPYLTYGVYMEYFGGKQKYPKTRQIFFGKKATIIIFIIILIYWIGRNLVKFG